MYSLSIPLVLCLLPSYAKADDTDTNKHWEIFKETHNKTFESDDHEDKSEKIFMENLDEIIEHNLAEETNYTKGTNKYSDMPPHEAIKMLCKYYPSANGSTTNERSYFITERLSEASVNWVERGKVTPVKDQGNCGSCTAHAVVQAVESATRIKRNWNGDFSVQQIVDCAQGGCNGGNNEMNYDYLIKAGGLQWASCYPYTGKDGTCTFDNTKCVGAILKSYVRVSPEGDENAVAEALAKNGPLSIGVHVTNDMFQYKSGIFHDDNCDQPIQHAVLLVGYGSENGNDYWLIKNSWGESWGMKGYMKLARNQKNMCRVATDASYPIIY